MSKNYEMMCILPGTLAQSDVPAAADAVKQALEEQGATEIKVNDLGKSRLAYPMKHIRYGYFFLITFVAEGENVVAIKEKLRLNTTILRQVIRTFDPAKAGEAPTTQETIGEIINEPKVRGAKKGKKEVRSSEKTRETKQKVESTDETSESDDKEDENAVPLEKIDEKLDEILEKSISDV